MSKPNVSSGSDYVSVLEAVREYETRSADWPLLRWAFLSNTTQEPLLPFLRRLCFDIGHRAEVRVGGYDTALQDAADPSAELFTPPPDIVVVALRLHVLAPALVDRFVTLPADAVEAEARGAVDYVASVVTEIRRRSRALVLVHSLETPLYPDLGVLDYRNAAGQVNTIRRANLDLTKRLSREDGVFVVDLDAVRARVGADRFADPRTWHLGRVAYTRDAMGGIAAEYMKVVRALKGYNKKCLVVDADNTLWGGIVGEDGAGALAVGRSFPGSAFADFQQALLTLRERGVLLALCSKNDPEAVNEVFASRAADMPLRLDHFAAVRVNWSDKAQNIREIAAELNIGLDSLVFVDDSGFEVNLVRETLPVVQAIQLPPDPTLYRDRVMQSGLFDTLTLSDEDRRRGDFYAAQRQRRIEPSSLSVEDYLRGLEMDVQVAAVDEHSIPRVAQLTQKTNQFNLTTRRYSDADIRALSGSPDHDVWAVRLRDRFGDAGIIGVVILGHEGRRSTIDSFLLSCRILGRGIEDVLLALCVRRSAARGSRELTGEYIPTARNGRVRDFYPSRGFVESAGGFSRSVEGAETEPLSAPVVSVTLNGEKVS